jgi:polysaccharide biosynthesis protein PslH
MRVLFLTHRLPYAPNRGDRIRAYHMLRVLAQRHEVDLVSLVHDAQEEAAAAGLGGLANSVAVARVSPLRNLARAPFALLGDVPLTHVLLDASGLRAHVTRLVQERPPDVVLAYCSGMARFALEPPLNEFPLVLDLVDVDSRKWATLASQARAPRRWIYAREATHLAAFERTASMRAATTTVVNDKERDSLLEISPTAHVRVIENGVDLTNLTPSTPPAAEPRVVFTGVFNYAPNVAGAVWMAEQVWPMVRAKRPDARLVLVGANPSRAVRALARKDPSIEVTGTVDDVRPYLWGAALSVVPLATARGLQNKVLEAMAAGLPVVITSVVRDGLPASLQGSCLVADARETFAAAVLSLLALGPAERRRRATGADLTALGWDRQLRPFLEVIEAAANPSHEQNRHSA